MKNLTILALVFVLAAGLMTGCGCTSSDMNTTPATTVAPTTAPTTAPVTRPSTAPTTEMTMPDAEEMIPGPEDTIDPSNGANNSTDNTVARNRRINREF